MMLVVGGIASGKRTYLYSLGYGDAQMSRDVRDDAPVLIGLEELLRDGPLDEDTFRTVCAKEVVTCREVGLGVVPLDAGERAWRETVGQTCEQLAERAERVIRMVCGIPLVLKGQKPATIDEPPTSVGSRSRQEGHK